MMRYFRLVDDMSLAGRWQIGEISDGDEVPDLLRDELYVPRSSLQAPITNPGKALDFSLTSFAVPIVTRPLSRVIEVVAVDAVRILQVTIESIDLFAVQCLRVTECLDESRSEFIKWSENDGRPDRVGDYRMVTRLFVDRSKISPSVHITRIKGWVVALIVSEVLKDAMERTGCLGAQFELVS